MWDGAWGGSTQKQGMLTPLQEGPCLHGPGQAPIGGTIGS